MNKLLNLKRNYVAAATLCLICSLTVSDSFAKSLYKSVDANGKVTYSNHPAANRQTAQNINVLKNSPKFSVSNKQASKVSSSS